MNKPYYVDPPDSEQAKSIQQRNRSYDESACNIGTNHHALTIYPVRPRTKNQPEEQVGQKFCCSGDAQAERRAGEFINEQRKREKRNRTAKI